MTDQRIRKATSTANMPSYDATKDSFSWQEAQALLDGLPGGHLNIAHEAIDRHVTAGHGTQIALRWIAKSGARVDFTYQDLQQLSNKFATIRAKLKPCGTMSCSHVDVVNSRDFS